MLPLEGIRVLDWTQWQQGPGATMLLGDLGAEVIKIEERVGGDPGRGVAPLRVFGISGDWWNYYFENLNRNKKSITLDLKKERGKEILYRLVEKSDVFVHNFRVGVAERLRADYETLSRYNPKLIYAHATAYGPIGPDAEKPGMDVLFQARSGLMTSIGDLDCPPHVGPVGLADQIGSSILVNGILAALLARERTGMGQKVETSGVGSAIWAQVHSIGPVLMINAPIPRRGRKGQTNPLWNHYQCQDGKWIMLCMPQSDLYWVDFCKALGKEELATDLKFEDGFKRAEFHQELIAILDKVFMTKSRSEWLKIFDEAGDFISGPVNTVYEVCNDPQVIDNQYVAEYNHPTYGKIRVMGFPIRFSRTPAELRLPAPEFGQHTEEVLLELGYSWEEIEKLKDEEVI